MSIYQGPNPKDTDLPYPAHSFEVITCLLDGAQHKGITKYLIKILSIMSDPRV